MEVERTNLRNQRRQWQLHSVLIRFAQAHFHPKNRIMHLCQFGHYHQSTMKFTSFVLSSLQIAIITASDLPHQLPPWYILQHTKTM